MHLGAKKMRCGASDVISRHCSSLHLYSLSLYIEIKRFKFKLVKNTFCFKQQGNIFDFFSFFQKTYHPCAPKIVF